MANGLQDLIEILTHLDGKRLSYILHIKQCVNGLSLGLSEVT